MKLSRILFFLIFALIYIIMVIRYIQEPASKPDLICVEASEMAEEKQKQEALRENDFERMLEEIVKRHEELKSK